MNQTPQSTGLAGPGRSVAGKILAVDYGRSRMGLAIAESPLGIAQPLATLERINRNEDMRRLRDVVRDNAVKLILVGLPLRLDGSRGEMAEEAGRFAQRVRKQIGVLVEMADERLTSWEAQRLFEEEFGRKSRQLEGLSRKRDSGKFTVDSLAATLILREYLERYSQASQEAGS